MRACFGHRISLVTALVVSGAGMALRADPGIISTANPSTKAITARRVFLEPLVPVGTQPTEAENAALSKALDAYVTKAEPKILTAFLEAHPNTPWKASLLSNLGWVYRRDGYLSRAAKAWREAWDLAKLEKGDREQVVADSSAANLAELLSRLGKREELASLLKETEGRSLTDSAASMMLLAKQQLVGMEDDPAHTLRCGPRALTDLAEALGRKDACDRVESYLAGPQGTNMAQLQSWGMELGVDLVGMELDAAAPSPVPALFHWEIGHFATVVKEEGNRYLVRNLLGGEDKWISRDVIEEEAGNHALVSVEQGAKGKLAPASLLSQLWGTGTTTGWPDAGANKRDPKCDPPSCPAFGMAAHSFYAAQVSLLVEDIPIWYNPPVGPSVSFHVYYNQWDLKQPATFTFWNFGPKWTMDWLSYVTDNPGSPGQNTTLYLRGGGIEDYTKTTYDSATGMFAPQYYHHDVLVRTSSASYERRLPDGSKEVFAASDGAVSPRRIFLTQIVDPSGNALTFGYDAQRRLVSVTDALGNVSTLYYELAGDPLKVTKVSDPFGRTATFHYDSANRLSRIQDMGGLSSEFTYGPTAEAPAAGPDFLNALITPYGKTRFSAGTIGSTDRWLQATDPLGWSERAEYRNSTGGMPGSEPVAPVIGSNVHLNLRNTLYWDKRAMSAGAGDWTQAKLFHFLHSRQDTGMTSPILESEKRPLESRVFYRYGTTYSEFEDAASLPTSTSRILDDGSTQTNQATYNAWGKVTKGTDAVGRVTSYSYSADGLDLLEIRNTTGTGNDLLAKYTYNTQHKPLTVTDAAGQTATFTYNAAGQIQTLTNPKSEVTTFTYSPAQGGYLMAITGAVAGATTSFTYDTFGRVKAVTGPDGNVIATDYDDLDRPTKVTYPDGTTEVMVYDKLDLIGKKDRQGRWTTMSYNTLRQLSEVQDAAGRSTRFDWCNCGSLEQLTDSLGRATNWWRDLQGRVIGKQLDDGKITSYTYDSTGRLVQRVDAKGQQTEYQYFKDNNLKQVGYPNARKLASTVGYTYDARYNRLASMVDGFGTTTYAYHPINAVPALGAGRLATVTGPFLDSGISYAYDELGRVSSRGINGVVETRTFDSLGRVNTVANQLGTFNYTYQGVTGRLDNILLPSGQRTVFSYFDATQDQRLQGISNQKSDTSVISAFNYTYNSDGAIKTWSQQADAQVPKVYSFSYDAANQLIGAVLRAGGPTGALIHQYTYGYDLAGNRTSEQVDTSVTTSDYNSTNQLTGQRKTP